ncbi:MAG: dTDP-4-dehydrorhamnose 3,5-epimerase [Desulfobacterales bacterium]|jgi:dTDP-4-dehydrorhamnose 3,5-epimerase|nr:dTDP-4-dehydrorhamnose 3,5-epimerase [Desulfobacterales bacterium]
MKFEPLSIPDVIRITPTVVNDQRGLFMETWRAAQFAQAGIEAGFVQENQSVSRKATLRGLHYQIRRPQGKLVRVVVGKIFDVAVDLRRSSPTFGRWVASTLSAVNRAMLWVPPGFAHGFLVLSETAEMIYKCTDYYAPEHERGIRWDDPELGIDWPMVSGDAPLLSPKDQLAKQFRDAEVYE